MPAPRLPTNVLALKGTFKANPSRGRQRASEPVVETVDARQIPVPATLSEVEALVWQEIVDAMPAGVVSQNDIHSLTILARLEARALYEPEIDFKVLPPLARLWAAFGMTPADRSRVAVSKGAARASPLDEFND